MKRLPLNSISQIENFLKGAFEQGVRMELCSKKDKYEFIETVLPKTRYNRLEKKEKNCVLKYLRFLTGYSKGHIKRCAIKWRKGKLKLNSSRKRNKFAVKYFANDIALLIETDYIHDHLSGEATKEILKREYEKFKKIEYGNISHISVSYIYHIRKNNRQYNSSKAKYLSRTKPVNANLGERRKPCPDGKPGFVRVDTVHQGDFNGKKGIYHINIVDEATQYETVFSTPVISERCLEPVLKEMLRIFPFKVYEFHSDNGSEYINRNTVKILNRLHIKLTKSRSRHSNDNALVETKNGSIVRKYFGRNFIDKNFDKEINEFDKNYLNIYLNYHRPCAYATDKIDSRGKIKKNYETWITPYDRLKSLKNAEQYLKENISFSDLDKLAYSKSDNDFGKEMLKAKERLFNIIRTKPTVANIEKR
jgi:transposase InsO family protein